MSKTKYADLKKKVIWVCSQMYEMGINQGTSGNVSARTDKAS
jgi:ribulose-5-phosphate 4-epimerase/fuculose-1-phosphate aldolase